MKFSAEKLFKRVTQNKRTMLNIKEKKKKWNERLIFQYLREMEYVQEYFLHGWISHHIFNSSHFRVMSLSPFKNTAGEKGVHMFLCVFHRLHFMTVYQKCLSLCNQWAYKGKNKIGLKILSKDYSEMTFCPPLPSFMSFFHLKMHLL